MKTYVFLRCAKSQNSLCSCLNIHMLVVSLLYMTFNSEYMLIEYM